MPRKALICFLALFLIQTARAQSLNDSLDQKYKNKLLALRTPFSSVDQKFDSDGHLLSDPAHGAWLVYGGIYVEKLDLSADHAASRRSQRRPQRHQERWQAYPDHIR